MNAKLGQKAQNNFEKSFFKLINNAVFRKNMENVRKHRKAKLVTTEKRRNYLVSESNYHTTIFFTKKLLAIEMRKCWSHLMIQLLLCLVIKKLIQY